MRCWAHFNGRLKDAIGIFSWHSRMCQGANPEEAKLDLYTTHEHITQVTLYPVCDGSRAKPGDSIEPLDANGRPAGIDYHVVGKPGDYAIPVKNSLGEKMTLPKDGMYIYWKH
jgi:hypothetical protein